MPHEKFAVRRGSVRFFKEHHSAVMEQQRTFMENADNIKKLKLATMVEEEEKRRRHDLVKAEMQLEHDVKMMDRKAELLKLELEVLRLRQMQPPH